MLSVIMLSVYVLSVVMLSVIMLNVVLFLGIAAKRHTWQAWHSKHACIASVNIVTQSQIFLVYLYLLFEL